MDVAHNLKVGLFFKINESTRLHNAVLVNLLDMKVTLVYVITRKLNYWYFMFGVL